MCALFAELRCAMCRTLVDEDRPGLVTFGGVLPPSDPCSRYCGWPLHWDCYATWSGRPKYARALFQRVIESEATDPYCGKCHLDDALLILVDQRRGEVQLHLADAGIRLRIALEDWSSWILSDAWNRDAQHALERAALDAVIPIMLQRFPTADDLVRAVNWAEKAPLIADAEKSRARREAAEEAKRKLALEKIAAINAAVPVLHEDLTRGRRACPHCGRRETGFILNEGNSGRSSFVVCTGCGRSSWPEDFAG